MENSKNYHVSIVYKNNKREKYSFVFLESAETHFNIAVLQEKELAKTNETYIKSMKMYKKDNGKRLVYHSYEEWMVYK